MEPKHFRSQNAILAAPVCHADSFNCRYLL
jgi:hypothetical protein